MKYIVYIDDKYPAWNHQTDEMEIEAKNKKEAISLARARVRKEWDRSRFDSPLLYRAEQVDEF